MTAPLTLHDSLIERSPFGVSTHHELPGGWMAIVAKHPRKVAMVRYLKSPPEALLRFTTEVAERWAQF